ncbi:hypothetical protein [Streptomyces sp. NPDC086835]|uniref:hypothetical protein n=1 Tax=Streptomyces sp. NPDC086835 TaxID=3365761 RepID=UPI003803E986
MAQADNDFGGDGSNGSMATVAGSGVCGADFGNSSPTEQVATGPGTSDQSNAAGANGLGFTVIDQGKGTVNFSLLR